MARFTGEVVQRIKPLLLPNGGPVIMLQIENEYRGTDLPYLKWAVSMARNTTTAVRLPRGGPPIPGMRALNVSIPVISVLQRIRRYLKVFCPIPLMRARLSLSLSIYLHRTHPLARSHARYTHIKGTVDTLSRSRVVRCSQCWQRRLYDWQCR